MDNQHKFTIENDKYVVDHWLYNRKEYVKLLDDGEDRCFLCSHRDVCAHKPSFCVNFVQGNSQEKYCLSCSHQYAKYDHKERVQCFVCKHYDEDINAVKEFVALVMRLQQHIRDLVPEDRQEEFLAYTEENHSFLEFSEHWDRVIKEFVPEQDHEELWEKNPFIKPVKE